MGKSPPTPNRVVYPHPKDSSELTDTKLKSGSTTVTSESMVKNARLMPTSPALRYRPLPSASRNKWYRHSKNTWSRTRLYRALRGTVIGSRLERRNRLTISLPNVSPRQLENDNPNECGPPV